MPVDGAEVARLLDRVLSWAASEPEVRAIALVGSRARGQARDDSDVDLLILARSPDGLVDSTAWTGHVGHPTSVAVEEWGAVRSVRVRYSDGQELDAAIGSLEWADTSPVDSGTRRVVHDGFVILYDPDRALAKLEASIHGDAP